jgi:uncharacterized protein YndB with AHSA1/START domain
MNDTTTVTTADRIEKHVTLRAPRTRVWRALVEPAQFGAWFGARLDGPAFTEGRTVRGPITYPGYEHLILEMQIERVEPERYFSYRWHPNAHDPAVDYTSEPTTLVEFTLEDLGAGQTALTIVESGFDRIPASRRAEAWRSNDGGWAEQTRNIDRYVTRT